MTLPTIVGLVASFISSSASVSQLVKVLKEKVTEGISIGMLLFLIVGLGTWALNGYLQEYWIIFGANTFSVMINLAVLIVTLIYRTKS